jgi:hypothetical protein
MRIVLSLACLAAYIYVALATQLVWDPALLNSSVPDGLADNQLVFGQPDNFVEVLVLFDGGV